MNFYKESKSRIFVLFFVLEGRKRDGSKSCRHVEIDNMIMNPNQDFFSGGGGRRNDVGVESGAQLGYRTRRRGVKRGIKALIPLNDTLHYPYSYKSSSRYTD